MIPIGTILAYVGNESQESLLRKGWMLCDGSEIPEALQEARDVIGTNVPNLNNGRFLFGDQDQLKTTGGGLKTNPGGDHSHNSDDNPSIALPSHPRHPRHNSAHDHTGRTKDDTGGHGHDVRTTRITQGERSAIDLVTSVVDPTGGHSHPIRTTEGEGSHSHVLDIQGAGNHTHTVPLQPFYGVIFLICVRG